MKQLSALGRYDAMDRLASLSVPNARFMELEDVGHGVPIHRPDSVNALLGEHFDGR